MAAWPKTRTGLCEGLRWPDKCTLVRHVCACFGCVIATESTSHIQQVLYFVTVNEWLPEVLLQQHCILCCDLLQCSITFYSMLSAVCNVMTQCVTLPRPFTASYVTLSYITV